VEFEIEDTPKGPRAVGVVVVNMPEGGNAIDSGTW
jgi:hypothetical protein